MSATPTASKPVLFVLWRKLPGKRQRWHKAGLFGTRREALAAISGAGDWEILPLTNPELAGSTSATPSKP